MPRSLLRTQPPSMELVRTIIRRDFHRYGIAVASFLAALAIRTLLSPVVGARPLLVMFAASVLLTAILAGLGPAILATGLVLIYDTVLAVQNQRLQAADILSIVTFCFIALEIYWFAERSAPAQAAKSVVQTAYIGDILDALSHEGLVTDLNGKIVSVEPSPEGGSSTKMGGRSVDALLAQGGLSFAGTNGPAGSNRWLVREEPVVAALGAAARLPLEIEVTEVRDAAGGGLLVWRLRQTESSATASSGRMGIGVDGSETVRGAVPAPRSIPSVTAPALAAEMAESAALDAVAVLRERMSAVSARERQVLDGLIEGRSNREIGLDLRISARTVERHRANIMAKMKAGSFSELIQMAIRLRHDAPVADAADRPLTH